MNRNTWVVIVALLLLGAAAVLWQKAPLSTKGNPPAETVKQESASQPASEPPSTSPLLVQYASAAPVIAPPQPEPTPAKGEAVIVRADRSIKPLNNAGQFERVAVGLAETVPIQLSWPDDKTHSDVFVQAVHGGKIDGGSNNKRFALGPEKTISFTFTPDGGSGSYQIALRRGTVEEALQFWVPTENPSNDPPTIK